MNFDEVKRVLLHPCWVPDPTAWKSGAAGIAFFAEEGRAGMFNLALLIVDCELPPPEKVYRERNLSWVITQAPMTLLDGRTLEAHAALRTLPDFCRVLKDSRMTRMSGVLTTLYTNGLKRLTHDIRHRRAAR